MDASPFDRYHVRERQREREGNIMRTAFAGLWA